MYFIIKNVISRGGYNLSAVLSKIDTVWAEGKLSDEQRDELIGLARTDADFSGSVEILAKLQELENRVRALEITKGQNTEVYLHST